jgi:hypothetical protein
MNGETKDLILGVFEIEASLEAQLRGAPPPLR